jgi:hypothetical protein
MTDFKGKFERTRPTPSPATLRRTGRQLLAHQVLIEKYIAERFELNAREEECWRMFGIDTNHVHDERIVYII